MVLFLIFLAFIIPFTIYDWNLARKQEAKLRGRQK